MEITLDTLTQHVTGADAVDLSGQDVYGYVFIPAFVFHRAMERIGLKSSSGYGRAVRYFRGRVDNLKVEFIATAMHDGRYARGLPTYYKVKAYVPSVVHITGKGRDKFAWSIYRAIAKIIEEERKEIYG